MREGRKDICLLLRSLAAEAQPQKQQSANAAALLLDDIVVIRGNYEEEDVPHVLLNKAYTPNARVYTTLMKGYMNAGRVDDVVAMLRAMQREGETTPASRPDHVTYTTVISALVAAGDMDRARAVLDDMAADGVPANRVTYNVLLKGYCHQLQITKARDLFQEMTTKQQSMIEPDVVTYNTLMDGCVLTDDSAGALAVFNEMRSRGIAPSTASYTTLMKAFIMSGQPKVAHKVFDEMERDPRVRVDRPAWNMLVEGYCRLGLLDTAKQVVEQMRERGVRPDVATYGSLVKAVAAARKPGEALLLWNEVKERCPEADEELLEALADVCVRAAFFKKALEIVACMEEKGIAPNKTKYKKMYIEMHSRMFTSKHASQARQDRRRERKRAAEAFKFWLGLPNSYYGTDTDWRIDD
uniref:Pentacotripeptide-repeat region of PRORP domain-containing protein n=1 Tax=Arundo donax TaxID=35708 RepID=A0A0A9DIB2_ARUDO